VVVQVAANAVERLLRVKPSIHGDQVVRHEQQANRRIGREPIHECFAGHALDRADQMSQRRPVDRIDSLE
jgi:hypothetical protein